MKFIRTATIIILATMFIFSAAIAEGKKLADKLSNTAIAVNIEVKNCDVDAAILCPGLPPE